MSTATTTIDTEAIAEEARNRLPELEERLRRLSLDALGGDAKQQQEVANVESQIAACKREVRQAELAGEEQVRRQQQADRDARETAIAAALRRAAKARNEVRAGERLIDENMQALARSVRAQRASHQTLSAELRAAGERGEPLAPGRYQGALAHHLQQAGVRDVFDLGRLTARVVPLIPEQSKEA